MFNPQVNVDLDLLLDSSGSFYKTLDEDSKTRIKNYWTVMIEAIGGLYYDLYQNYFGKLLHYTQGYIEDRYQSHRIIFDGDSQNTVDIMYSSPTVSSLYNIPSSDEIIYSYSVSAVTDYGETTASQELILVSGASDLSLDNNYFSWNLVSGISAYNIYGGTINNFGLLHSISGISYTVGGTYEFVDNGSYTVDTGTLPPTENTAIWSRIYTIPTNYYYMTIPTLSGQNTGQVLYENIDYEIEDLTKIKFIKPLSSGVQTGYISYNTANAGYEIAETFIANQQIYLIPNLTSVYWPGLGIDEPYNLINDNYYYPFISGIEALSYFDQRVLYSKHITLWTYGLINNLRKEPTMTNIRAAVGYLMGLPFSYEDGTVITIENDGNYKYITISGTNSYTYKVPNTLEFAYTVSGLVSRFDLLTDGTYVSDYIEEPTLVSGNTLRYGQITEYDIFTQVYSDNDHRYKVLNTLGENIATVKTGDSTTREII